MGPKERSKRMLRLLKARFRRAKPGTATARIIRQALKFFAWRARGKREKEAAKNYPPDHEHEIS